MVWVDIHLVTQITIQQLLLLVVYYFALNAQSPITDKSPYIYNVTTFGAGATGAIVDGSLHSTGNRSMLFHTVYCYP